MPKSFYLLPDQHGSYSPTYNKYFKFPDNKDNKRSRGEECFPWRRSGDFTEFSATKEKWTAQEADGSTARVPGDYAEEDFQILNCELATLLTLISSFGITITKTL